jgi:hypothetical protein
MNSLSLDLKKPALYENVKLDGAVIAVVNISFAVKAHIF